MRAGRVVSFTSVGVASVFCALVACGGSGNSNQDQIDAPTGGPNTCYEVPSEIAVCSSDSDCTTYLDGCYCGSQPMNGVNVTHAAAVNTCEAGAAEHCALGCANFPGFIAEDGNMADSSASISVHCEPATNLCKTYVP
jgi:hypothetical protein